VISRQFSGPGLYAGRRVTLNGGPGAFSGSVGDQRRDAAYSANGSRVPASGFPQLDVTGASITQPRNKPYLLAHLHVRNLRRLLGSANLGGTDVSWMVRWTQVHQHKAGNGLIYYVGVDNNGRAPGTNPTFFFGSTSCIPANNPQEHCKFLTYPQTTPTGGRLFRKRGILLMRIPRAAAHLHRGSRLRSVTGFTTTATSPQSATTIFNLIDAAAPFDVRVAR
jgi:hypothetical protein